MQPTSPELNREAATKARAILEKNITPLGMMASAAGYPQVWARDSMLTLLGATRAD